MLTSYSISGISIVSPDSFRENSSIKINTSRIEDIGNGVSDYDIKPARRLYLYPAIINIHDHFRGNYLPKVGPKNGTFYLNWSFWDNDLKSAPVYSEREKNTISDLYTLSMYKNIFSGVATVHDHFPHTENEKYISGMPIRVISKYALVHAICPECSYALRWGDSIEIEHNKAVTDNIPFITHCAEGFDKDTQSAIQTLDDLKCLDDHDVLIHCIGCSDDDLKKIRKNRVNMVWCPGSNMYMFNVTCKIRKILEAGINISIGTDSTHSGTVNILEEMRYGREVYYKMYGEELDAETIFRLVTKNPAIALRKQDEIGSIEKGKNADMLLVAPEEDDPYKAFVNLKMENIELLTLEGNPVYGSSEFEDLFEKRSVQYTKVKVRKKEKCIVGDPAGLMERIRKAVGYKKEFDFIPLD